MILQNERTVIQLRRVDKQLPCRKLYCSAFEHVNYCWSCRNTKRLRTQVSHILLIEHTDNASSFRKMQSAVAYTSCMHCCHHWENPSNEAELLHFTSASRSNAMSCGSTSTLFAIETTSEPVFLFSRVIQALVSTSYNLLPPSTQTDFSAFWYPWSLLTLIHPLFILLLKS